MTVPLERTLGLPLAVAHSVLQASGQLKASVTALTAPLGSTPMLVLTAARNATLARIRPPLVQACAQSSLQVDSPRIVRSTL